MKENIHGSLCLNDPVDRYYKLLTLSIHIRQSPEELLVSIYICPITSSQIKSQAQIVSAE